MTPGMDIFVVQHLHIHEDGEEDVKFIGVYSSREEAERAVERLKLQPGFCDVPDGFSIDPYGLDEDSGWAGGYVTVRHSDNPDKGEDGEDGTDETDPKS
jgi:hypothetical protein